MPKWSYSMIRITWIKLSSFINRYSLLGSNGQQAVLRVKAMCHFGMESFDDLLYICILFNLIDPRIDLHTGTMWNDEAKYQQKVWSHLVQRLGVRGLLFWWSLQLFHYGNTHLLYYDQNYILFNVCYPSQLSGSSIQPVNLFTSIAISTALLVVYFWNHS